MAKNVDHIQHIKSNVVLETGKPKLPQPSALVEGELAINYAEGVETISIKNASGDIVTFSSDNYYTEQKLGSGFTGENSANTVTDVIEANELVTSTALNDLKENKLDVSAYTPSVELWVSGTGENAIAQKGGGNTASGKFSVAMGSGTTASGDYSVAEGKNTTASGSSSHAEGNSTTASGNQSHAEGGLTLASGDYSHAEGESTSATSDSSHAEGRDTLASGYRSHAEGYNTIASGGSSHAEGGTTKAFGNQSHAEGANTVAKGDYSHAEGDITIADGVYSHTEGSNTIALNQSEHASGQYNISSSSSSTFGHSGNTLFSVGNGESNGERHNAFEIRQNGDIYITSGNTDILLQDNLGGTVDQVIDSGTSASTDAVSTSAVYGFVTSYTPSITVDQVLDNTTSASTNPVSSKAVYDAVTDNELVWTNAFVALSGITSAHTANTEIHVTAADKTAWSGKIGYAEYDSTNKLIIFYDEENGSSACTIDATDFIKDGMVNNVEIKDVASGEPAVNVTCLVITFNSDSGKQDINIPISDIFNASNYYTKTEVDARDLWVSGTGLNSVVLKGSSGTASGDYSVAEGKGTSATSQYSHAEGYYTKAIGENSHSEGQFSEANGINSHAEGYNTKASGDTSHSEGNGTNAGGWSAHAEGSSTVASGDASHAEGSDTVANANYSHAEGWLTSAMTRSSHAECYKTLASGEYSHAEGYKTSATTDYTHSEGRETVASGLSSHAEGQYTKANGNYSHAEGYETKANGNYSHAEGCYTKANAYYSHADGYETITNNQSECASGQFNISSSGSSTFGHSGNTLFSVGNGTQNSLRHNAFEIRQNGDIYISSGNSDIKLQDYIGADLSNYYDKTEIDNLVGSGFTSSSITDVIIENEEVVSAALADLDERKLDATAYTPTDLSNYYTKSETSGATEISTALGAKSDTGHTHEASGVTAMTGYQMAASSASVLTTDTLLQVIGKLEKRISLLETSVADLNSQSETVATALVELHSEIGDIETLLSQI